MSESQFNQVGHIIDIEKTKNKEEFALSTREGLRFATINPYNAVLNKKDELFRGKSVISALQYQPNLFIVIIDGEQ